MEFDPSKENSHVVSGSDPHGADFRILGVMFDTKLRMHAAVHEVAVECAWELIALFRSRRYHDVPRLVLLYKAQLLSYIENRTPAIYHAACSELEPVDGVQQILLRETCVSDEDALFVFHLAPFSVRSDIAMLGVIHRTVLGRGPSQFRRRRRHKPSAEGFFCGLSAKPTRLERSLNSVSSSNLRRSTATLPEPAPNVPDTVFD